MNCQWGDWIDGKCSKTCGGGTLTSTRNKTIVESDGGTCNGKSTKIEDCNTNDCPCKFEV